MPSTLHAGVSFGCGGRMHLLRGLLLAGLVAGVGACGSGGSTEDGALPLAGQTWNFWAFSGAPGTGDASPPWFGAPLAGIAIEEKGRLTLFAEPITGRADAWRPLWVLFEVYGGSSLWIRLGSDRFIESIHTAGDGDQAVMIVTESSDHGYRFIGSDGSEVHLPKYESPDSPIPGPMLAVHTRVVTDRARIEKSRSHVGRAVVLSEDSTWHLLKLAAATIVALGGGLAGAARCPAPPAITLACAAGGAVGGAYVGWNAMAKFEGAKDILEDTFDLIDELTPADGNIPDLPHECYWRNYDCAYRTGGSSDGVRRVCEQRLTCPSPEPPSTIPLPPLTATVRLANQGADGGACYQCVNDATGPGGTLPLDDPAWQEEEMARCRRAAQYRATSRNIWEINLSSMVIGEAVQGDSSAFLLPGQAHAGSSTIELRGNSISVQWNAENTESGHLVITTTANGSFLAEAGQFEWAADHSPTWWGPASDDRWDGTWRRAECAGSWLGSTQFYALRGLGSTWLAGNQSNPSHQLSEAPWTFTHGVSQTLSPTGNTEDEELYVCRFRGTWRAADFRSGLGIPADAGEASFSCEVVDRFFPVSSDGLPPELECRYEPVDPGTDKPRVGSSTEMASGPLPVLVFEKLYDPDNGGSQDTPWPDRGIAAVDVRYFGNGARLTDEIGDLGSGQYDARVTAYDDEGQSTTVTIPLTIP